MTGPLPLTLPPEAVEAIAERAAELVLERSSSARRSPWMTRAQAATYLGVPESRLEKDASEERPARDPLHRDGAKVLYHRDELDRWLLNDSLDFAPVTAYYSVSRQCPGNVASAPGPATGGKS